MWPRRATTFLKEYNFIFFSFTLYIYFFGLQNINSECKHRGKTLAKVQTFQNLRLISIWKAINTKINKNVPPPTVDTSSCPLLMWQCSVELIPSHYDFYNLWSIVTSAMDTLTRAHGR